MIDGEPSVDMIGVDPRAISGWFSKNFAKLKNTEAYEHVFHHPLPDGGAPRLPSGKGAAQLRADGPHGRGVGPTIRLGAAELVRTGGGRAQGRVFLPPVQLVRARRQRGARDPGTGRGLIELSSFSKFEAEGPGVREWLDRLVANNIPRGIGRISLAHALNPSGSIRSEFTITRLSDGPWGERFFLVSSGAAHDYDLDFLTKLLPGDGSVYLKDVTTQYGVFVLAGPQARNILQRLADADVSNEAFPWLTAQEIPVGFCPSVRALRVNFVGSLGWELHHPIEYHNHLFDALMEAGEAQGIGLVGMRAMDSMRLEKSYRLWGTDLNQENTIFEAGLERFVRLNKPAFTGQEALIAQRRAGVPNTFCTIEIDADDADSFGNEPVFMDDEVVGRGTAGGYGHYVKKSLMLGYVRSDAAKVGRDCRVRVLDQLRPARIISDSPYDPENAALRA